MVVLEVTAGSVRIADFDLAEDRVLDDRPIIGPTAASRVQSTPPPPGRRVNPLDLEPSIIVY
jgi:hypothetical protein